MIITSRNILERKILFKVMKIWNKPSEKFKQNMKFKKNVYKSFNFMYFQRKY